MERFWKRWKSRFFLCAEAQLNQLRPHGYVSFDAESSARNEALGRVAPFNWCCWAAKTGTTIHYRYPS